MRSIRCDKRLFLVLMCLVAGIAFSQPKKANTKKPNVIVILTDDMGFSDIGCFGSEIKTPNIDKLATNGISFTHFYNTARCSPSRASLMTGLYPHQAGMGFLSNYNYDEAGYVDDLSKKAVTIAEVFKQAGYATYMSGKWHLNKEKSIPNDRSNWPLQRGFDRFFGMLIGSGSFYDPGTLMSDNTFIAPGKDFYLTHAITNNVVRFIDENPKEKPFFFYIAYTAAHWPLQAPENEVQKYKGVYDKGWDETRKLRFEKLKKLGIISKKAVLTARGVDIPEWKNEPMKDWQVRRMEVYAAMVDIMDQGIGKIISTLEKNGELENTVIFYMHDNGGCAETLNSNEAEIPLTDEQKKGKPFAKDSIFLGKIPTYTRDGEFIRSGKGIMPGPANTWTAYGEEWANVSSTPFRLYKHFVHEGGIASPLIIHWPEGIKAKGKLRTQPGHLIDIMATCVEIAGLQYPTNFNGNAIYPLEGKSLVPAFTNKSINREFIFWEHEGNRAIRMGNWKLVSKTQKQKKFTPADENSWELYDMEEDPSESINLAFKYPDKVKTMAALWEKEARRTMAKPWPWGSN
ncbi:arylsulfatase [Flavobacterium sp.]|uniref:arylsulfatase n=1 Tax=Flavobacterium sp. TaxID=239 RepID=UPI0038FD0108